MSSPVEFSVSRHFLSWLYDCKISLAFTTYQTNRLFLIGLKPDGALSIFERYFERPMGLCADGEKIYMSSRWQLWELSNALPPGEQHNGFDRLYVPRHAHTTGDLDTHDVAVDSSGRVIFVNTLYSCLATVSERYSFRPLWKPPFISKLAPEDRCHLNGLTLIDGAPAYVTAVSRSDVAAGWRERRHTGGVLIDVEDNEIVLDQLSMPHSPRAGEERLWLLNSGTGELGFADRRAGRFESVAFCPGYLRGLAWWGDYAIVGLSKQRQERTFAGLALDDRLKEKDTDACCGLWVVNLRTGNVAHWLRIEGVVIELYDVAVIPGARRPMVLGFKTDEIQRLQTIDMAPRPMFMPLSVSQSPPPASRRAEASGQPAAAAGQARIDAAKASAEYQLGNQLARGGHFAEAIEHYRAAISADPRHVNAHVNLSTAQHRLGNVEEALKWYRRAIELDERSVRGHMNLGLVLREQRDLARAIEHFERARQIEPGNAVVLQELGLSFYLSGRTAAAKSCFGAAVRANPNSAEAHNSMGGILRLEKKNAAALRFFKRAVELKPDFFEAHENLGMVFEEEGRLDQAKGAYERALAVRDDPALALHRELLCPPVFASLEELEAYRTRAESVIRLFEGRIRRLDLSRLQCSRGGVALYEWTYHGRDNLPLKRKYAALFEGVFSLQPLPARRSADQRRRVGFVVTTRHEGVFARCLGGLVERLDRSKLEPLVVCPAAGAGVAREIIRQTPIVHLPLRFDHAAETLRSLHLDVIYYWEVGTDEVNYFLAFLRLAPAQCTGWGWPDTSAAPELDYHITSEALAGPEAERYFSETLVRLPHLPAYCHMPPVRGEPRPPSHFGLPEDARLYLCAQNLRKVHPDFDALVAGILQADPRAVVAFVQNEWAAHGEILRKRWQEQLPDLADRISIIERQGTRGYMDLLASAHVLLDTLYFGGSNTAYDAIAAGTPVVTLPGDQPRSRYTAALHSVLGTEECVVDSAKEYVETAVRIANDAELCTRLRERIRNAAGQAFENPGAVEQLERFFSEVAKPRTV